MRGGMAWQPYRCGEQCTAGGRGGIDGSNGGSLRVPGAAVVCLLAYLAVLRGRPCSCSWPATCRLLLCRGTGHLAWTWGKGSTCLVARGKVSRYMYCCRYVTGGRRGLQASDGFLQPGHLCPECGHLGQDQLQASGSLAGQSSYWGGWGARGCGGQVLSSHVGKTRLLHGSDPFSKNFDGFITLFEGCIKRGDFCPC